MIYKKSSAAIAACIAIASLGTSSSFAEPMVFKTGNNGSRQPVILFPDFGIHSAMTKPTPTQPLAAPPGMVPMIVYVPAQQMQPAAVPPHTHAPMPPQAAQTINATHCSINDVAVLTKDAPSCQKAGGKVVTERATFSVQICGESGCSGPGDW